MSATVTAASAISAGCPKNGHHPPQPNTASTNCRRAVTCPQEHHFRFGCHRIVPVALSYMDHVHIERAGRAPLTHFKFSEKVTQEPTRKSSVWGTRNAGWHRAKRDSSLRGLRSE